MKIIDREFRPKSNDPRGSYKPMWTLFLECGHTRHVCTNDGPKYTHAATSKRIMCQTCEKPATKRPPDLMELAEYIISRDL
jgi:hypothetical protein